MLSGDSQEYDLLEDAARNACRGLAIEIGCRLGAGVEAIAKGREPGSFIISVDPYGGLPYQVQEGITIPAGSYSNDMLAEAMCSIPAVCRSHGINWLPIVMEDGEFFRRFSDGVPLYSGHKRIINEYALVHLDGPHDMASVMAEIEFFAPRMANGGKIVLDDWQDCRISHTEVRRHGFELSVLGSRKAVYTR
jgi:hypothetical protein